MANVQIDPNSPPYREAMYAIDESLLCISVLSKHLQCSPQANRNHVTEILKAIQDLTELSERLIGILRHYGQRSGPILAQQYPLARLELTRIRNTIRQRIQFYV